MRVRSAVAGFLLSLLFSLLFALLLGVFSLSAWADQCNEIKDKIAQLQSQIDEENKHLYLPCCKPGLPLKPEKDPEVEQKIKADQMALSAEKQALTECFVPPPAPAPALVDFSAPGIHVPDPQIAVGHKYFLAIDTSTFGFYQKSNQNFAPSPFDSQKSFVSLFQTFFKAIDEFMALPTWMCDPNNTGLVFKDPNKTLIKNNFGCIAQAYDARVYYDASRHRFWLASAVRPFIWECTTADGQKGLETEGPQGVIWDPDPHDPSGKTPLCHTDWKQKWMHRFIVVAVSKTDSDGKEDLSKPFHMYALTDTLGDWPQMSVNDDYLVLDHFDTKNPDRDPVEVFDAKKLADGVMDGTALKVNPVITIPLSDFSAGSGSHKVTASGGIFLVNNHGSSQGITYMIGVNGHDLLIFGLKSPANGSNGAPKKLNAAVVDLGHDVGSMRNNAVFREGKLYLSAFFCETNASDGTCVKYAARIYRVPVGLSADGNSVHASGPGAGGFLDYVVGSGSGGKLSLENTMIEVTQDRDMVLGFEAVGLESDHRQPAGIKYAVFYHNKGNISENGTIHHHEGDAMPDPPDPGRTGGVIDLGGIALDPSDQRTVWIAHGFSKNGKYAEAVGAVKP